MNISPQPNEKKNTKKPELYLDLLFETGGSNSEIIYFVYVVVKQVSNLIHGCWWEPGLSMGKDTNMGGRGSQARMLWC